MERTVRQINSTIFETHPLPENRKSTDGLEAQSVTSFTPPAAAQRRRRPLALRPGFATKAVGLTIAALAAVAYLAAIHRAIFAGRLARGLLRRQRSCANHGRDNGIDNFGEPLHTSLNLRWY
jgi:hypothetical protein